MPYDIVRDTIEQNLKEKCSRVRRYIKKIEKQRRKRKSQYTTNYMVLIRKYIYLANNSNKHQIYYAVLQDNVEVSYCLH